MIWFNKLICKFKGHDWGKRNRELITISDKEGVVKSQRYMLVRECKRCNRLEMKPLIQKQERGKHGKIRRNAPSNVE